MKDTQLMPILIRQFNKSAGIKPVQILEEEEEELS